ncbi:hypothetical protein [Clostridium saccharoperbutylacetonicum]|uniref:hypothetical protein n=1 Tax=Clostridium saccharoperbutylacetonicum TaxID=36745 RepID=UPI000983D857|nr:hypothetical protein [Clostridium saccharoperbutylacetonicum]AQR96544.1 hypothetical protein CLSAP_38680 [Clostridium saccharoperbutylacetonicum]NSB32420.1 hypothetical protein [Clostridium saccharoperbutylacetonicum]
MKIDILKNVEKKLTPFDGNILRLNMNGEKVPISVIREIVEEIFLYLGRNNLCGKIYRYDDWLQHDGPLFYKERFTYKKLKQILNNNKSFYNSRNGDDLVRRGYYDSRSRWYVRVYILDRIDLKKGEELWGDFDISISDYHIYKLKEIIENEYSVKLGIEEAYTYFQRINVANSQLDISSDINCIEFQS